MAKATLTDGTVINFPNGLPPEKVKKIISNANEAHGGQPKKKGGSKATTVPTVEPSPVSEDIPLKPEVKGPQPDYLTAEGSALRPLEDIGVGAVTGVNTGVAAMRGLPGEVQKLARMGDDAIRGTWLGKALGTPDKSQFETLPDVDQSLKWFEGKTGALPQPQTRAGEYAKAMGEFLPGGGGRGALQAAGKVGSAMLLGGATEGGADIGKALLGPEGEDIGRTAGTLLGVAAHAAPRPNILKSAKGIEGVPETAREAKNLKDAAYGHVKNDAQRFSADATNRALLRGVDEARREGYNVRNTPAMRDYLRKHAANEPPRAIDIEVARQKANKMSNSKDVGKSRVGVAMRESLDRHIGNDVFPQRPDLAHAIMEGRLNTQSYKLGKDVEKIITKGSNAEDVQSSLRTRMRTQLGNKEEQLPAELNAGMREFLKKPVMRRAMKQGGALLRNVGGLASGASVYSGKFEDAAAWLAAKGGGHVIKYFQDKFDIGRAELVKKIALMQPHQRAQLGRSLLAAQRRKRQLLGEAIATGAGSLSNSGDK